MSLELEDPADRELQHVRTALKNWKAIWNRRLSIDRCERGPIAYFDISIEPEGETQVTPSPYVDDGNCHSNDWRRAGFWRHASEYWLLARVFVDEMESAQRRAQAAKSVSRADTSICPSELKILSRYDEKDMSELHSFLASCMQIH